VILTGMEIGVQCARGRIKISDFEAEQLTTNSYDLRLGSRILRYLGDELDAAKNNEHEVVDIPPDGMTLAAGEFVLGETFELIGSDHYVPIIHAKSGTARLGLFVHVTADLIDIGSHGRSTLQLYATLPVRIYPMMKIAQVTFWKPKGEIKLYAGKYAGSTGPVASMSYKDFAVDVA